MELKPAYQAFLERRLAIMSNLDYGLSPVGIRKRLRRLVQQQPQARYTLQDFERCGLAPELVFRFLGDLGLRYRRRGFYRGRDISDALGLGVQVEISPKPDGTAKGT